MHPSFRTLLALGGLILSALPASAYDTVVVVNEVHYNPPGTTEEGEWIELHNQNGINVDISGWRLSGGVDFVFPNNTTIPGKGHVVVAKNPALSGFSGAMGPWIGTLNNSGETIRLRDNNDRIMDEVGYGDKGSWPIPPDGSGATLSKRSADGGSGNAADWTFSSQSGGTPNAVNFAPPPLPSTSRVLPRDAVWRFLNTGADPGATWKTAAFSDAAWPTGQGMFRFGSAQIWQPGTPVVAAGILNQVVWTGDSTSLVGAGKTYTHKIGLNRTGGYTAINAVVFNSPGINVRSGANWSLTGADYTFNGNGVTGGANSLPAGTGSRQLCEDFFYGANDSGKSRITLSGLTAGNAYVATFYTTGFGGPGQRLTNLTASDSGKTFLVDENATNSGNGLIVRYRYTAPAGGTIRFDFTPIMVGNTWHHYAFSNETATTAPTEVEVIGATVNAFSSQLTSGFTRAAVHTVNGSGLTSGGQHGTTPDGTMWLSNGTFTAPNDPLPAEITYDLGGTTSLTSLHIWNYNELNIPTRGARTVEISTASAVGGPFTLRGTVTLFQASGLSTEPGQHVELIQNDVRLVKLNITTNHGGDNAFAGLSEVKFYKVGTVGVTPPELYREAVAGVFNSGVDAAKQPLAPNSADPHYVNTATNSAAIAMTAHPAWLQDDGISRFIGLTGNGTDNVAAGTFTYRTTADLSGYDAATASLAFYIAADNQLDSVKLNNVTVSGISGGGFTSFLGPFVLPGPFNAGGNSVDFTWTNAGPAANPGGVRIKWDAKGVPAVAKTTLAANPTTTWFRKSFTLTGLANSTYTGVLQHVVDDGAVFYINGIEVARTNLTGTPTASTPADSDVVYPMFSANIAIPPGILQAGNNILAVELHQASGGAADALFGATLDVTETPAPVSTASLKVDKVTGVTSGVFAIDLRNDTTVALNLSGYKVVSSAGQEFLLSGSLAAGGWLTLDQTALGFRPLDGEKLFLLGPSATVLDGVVVKNRDQARNGVGEMQTPAAYNAGGQAVFTIPTALVINEIMYHHHPTYLPTGIAEHPEEWIELHNKSTAAVNLAGWKLRGGVSFDFISQSIPAGGYLVVARDPVALAAAYPAISIAGPWSGSLSNKQDEVRLEDANGNTADEVKYQSFGRWSEWADGGGSSLELRDPDADNALPESWAASDELGKSAWQNFTWEGSGMPFGGSNDPTAYHEFILGLLSGGGFLVDDISVKEVNVGGRELIQNGNFSGGAATAWRLLGNHGSHGRSVVVDDPSSPGNKVLKIVASSGTEHMHNHCETTLKNGGTFVSLSNGSTYKISFRARWVKGCPRLHARLYFNRLAKQNILPMPTQTGTPGTANSTAVPNIGPGIMNMTHLPAVPSAGNAVTVRVQVNDPDGMGQVTLHYRDGNEVSVPAFTTVAMAPGAGGYHEAAIPSQVAGRLLEFYVSAADALGATGRYPAESALVKWNDGTTPPGPGHGLRVLMTKANADLMHLPSNVMSNDYLPATVIYKESEVFYDARCRTKSSERGRPADIRLGFAIQFDPMQPFRGKMTTINLDRSSYGRGTNGSGYGQSELWNWHFFNRAGGIPSMYNDLVYLISPRPAHVGSAALTMAEFNDAYLDGQFGTDGGGYPTFKYELIYWPTTTEGGTPEGLKLPSPDEVNAVSIGQITPPDKEAYRWHFLIQNARIQDDYSRIVNLNDVFRQTGSGYVTNLPNAIDVSQWLRCFAAFSLAGIGDHYTTAGGGWHNLKLYHREDGRVLFLPWDHDFNSEPSNAALVRAPALSQMMAAKPEWHRLYYVHLHDIISKSFNTTYAAAWNPHFQSYTTTGGDWNSITTYVTERVAFANGQCASAYPIVAFDITTGNFTTPNSQATVNGTAWINVFALRVQGSSENLVPTWTSGTGWQVTLPILQGANTFVIEGLSVDGTVVASDTITITGTGGIVAADASNLVVSELHYHPADATASEVNAGYADAEDFEFVELQNISSFIVDLTNVRFVGGIEWSAVGGTQIPVGGRVVIPRRSAAFALRHPATTALGPYYRPTDNFLSNGGEELALVDGSGADIKRFTYNDAYPWPGEADGLGASLVLITPTVNPDHSDPLSWRPSLSSGGNPGTADRSSLPANPLTDDNQNGLSNLVDYAVGHPGQLPTISYGPDFADISISRAAGAQVRIAVETATTLLDWQAQASPELIQREFAPDGTETLTFRVPIPLGAENRFFIRARYLAE